MFSKRNFFDPPFVAMLDSGTFWRCPHGRTRFSEKGACRKCGIRRPLKYSNYLWKRFREKLGRFIHRD